MLASKNVIVFVAIVCCAFSSRTLFSDHSENGELGFTTYIPSSYEGLIKLEDGTDLSGKDLSGIHIHRSYKELKNVDFSSAYLSRSNFDETIFVNCSFHHANLVYVDVLSAKFINCDFTDADIVESDVPMTKEQLLTTRSFKLKDLSGYNFRQGDMRGLDFSGFDLKGAKFSGTKVDGCNFSGAEIFRTDWNNSLPWEQLCSTASFKKGELLGIHFYFYDFSEMNLSQMNLTGSIFWSSRQKDGTFKGCNFRNVDLSDSVISQCAFWDVENLTLAQIKSTWNYKTGNMAGIKLPKEIQAALDAEQKTKEKPQ